MRPLFPFELFTIAMSLATLGVAHAAEPASRSRELALYIGAYTGPGSGHGIYLAHFNLETGNLTAPTLAAESVNPSFLALHPSHKFLFVVNEIENFNGKKEGSVSGFAIDSVNGKLTAINQQPSGGTTPCHLSVTPDGRHLLVANYGGSFSVIPVAEDGTLSAASCIVEGDKSDPRHQPHAHCIALDPSGKFALADDLGLDRIFIFRWDASGGVLTPNEPSFVPTSAGAGPRHFAFHPNGKWVYSINELNSTMDAFLWDPSGGVMARVDWKSTLTKAFQGHNICAEIVVHPNGKFVYCSNRGDDSIAGFEIDAHSGMLRSLGRFSTGGRTPRSFAIDPSGNWILAANQDSNNVTVLRIDAQTGELKQIEQRTSVPAPACVLFAGQLR